MRDARKNQKAKPVRLHADVIAMVNDVMPEKSTLSAKIRRLAELAIGRTSAAPPTSNRERVTRAAVDTGTGLATFVCLEVERLRQLLYVSAGIEISWPTELGITRTGMPPLAMWY